MQKSCSSVKSKNACLHSLPDMAFREYLVHRFIHRLRFISLPFNLAEFLSSLTV